MSMVRFVIRSSVEAYRQIRVSRNSFFALLIGTSVVYTISGMTAIQLHGINRIATSLKSADIFALVDRDIAGVVRIGEQLRSITGVRSVDFVFPEKTVSVHETDEKPSSSPYIFFHLRSSASTDTLHSVMEQTRRISGVLDVLYSDQQTESLRLFQRTTKSGRLPLFKVIIGLYVGIVILLSWSDVVRYAPTIRIMRALGASRLYTSMPCAIIGGIRGVIGMAVSIPVMEVIFRLGFFDTRKLPESDGLDASMGLIAITGMLAPVLCSFFMAWMRASFEINRDWFVPTMRVQSNE